MTESQLTKRQRAKFGPAHITYGGEAATITAEVRYDDDCGNGHNTFSITGEIRAVDRRKYRADNGFMAGGCLHEEIAAAFPQLAPLIKWHLCSSDGPMHYPANVLYFVSERDCWGALKGEPRQWETSIQFGDNPIKHHLPARFVKFLQDAGAPYDFEVLAIEHGPDTLGLNHKFRPKYTFGGYGDEWHNCPFDSEQEALDFLYALQHCSPQFVRVATVFGEGKARELDAARAVAIWPDATDAELCAPDLAEKLAARLPALLAEFRAAVESLGFTW